jgi:ribosomal-protein-alanine N-acetyltransferase
MDQMPKQSGKSAASHPYSLLVRRSGNETRSRFTVTSSHEAPGAAQISGSPPTAAQGKLHPMLIRRMTLADCEGLEDLFTMVPGNVDPRAELLRPLTRAWVACAPEGGQVLGYALAWWVVDELELLALATRVESRRRGIARALLAELISSARGDRGRRVSLEVARSNSAALQLYESSGFVVFNVRRGYYRKTGEDALLMELGLDTH